MLDINFIGNGIISSLSFDSKTSSGIRYFLDFSQVTNSYETKLTHGYNLMDILQNSAYHYQILGSINTLPLRRILETQFA